MRLRARGPAIPVLAMLPLLATLAGCGSGLPPQATAPAPVVGTGSIATEDRTTDAFQRVSVGGGLHVDIAVGSPLQVTVSAQANLLPLIVTRVSDGQLIVNIAPPGISTSQPMTLTVIVPDLRSITLSGGATGSLDATATDLAIDVSGGVQLDATGRVSTLRLTTSSGAQARLSGLAVDSATVTMSGGSRAELNVTGDVSGTATEGANLRLSQPPASTTVTTSGGAVIQGA